MKKLTTLLVALVSSVSISSTAMAAGGGDEVLDSVYFNKSDKASLQNGAKLFVNYCLGCHSAGYARYNLVAQDLEIPMFRLKEGIMFTSEKEGDLMKTNMPAEDAKAWFGVTPPDLTLVARVRKPDWIYTYLRGFYQDDSKESGWNNSLFKNVAMPHVMHDLQGVQRLVEEKVSAEELEKLQSVANPDFNLVGDAKLELVKPGQMTPAEFDKAMADITGFLTYLGEPAIMKRESIGIYAIGFMLILLGLCILLKKEYWRDIH